MPSAVARGLRALGVDVLTVAEAGLRGAPDEAQLAWAWRERRVFFTHDEDFLRLHAAGAPHVGIVYATGRLSIGNSIHGLMLIYQVLDAEDMQAHVEYL